MEFEKITVSTKEQLDLLYSNSALTMEGLSEESIPDFLKWIESITPLKERTVYVISGAIMNYHYSLTGSNAYNDGLTIVSIPLNCMENPMALAIPRFQVGARWFDDIVDNNANRER